jgi:hypothetical protein
MTLKNRSSLGSDYSERISAAFRAKFLRSFASLSRQTGVMNVSSEASIHQTEETRMKTEHEATTATGSPKTAAKTKRASATKKTAKPAAKKASKATVTKKRVAKTEIASATKKPRAAPEKKEARADTKKAIVLELLRRKEGATMAEIAKATDWQKHSIRGFISGHVTKKMGLAVESSKNEAGERTYRIAK